MSVAFYCKILLLIANVDFFSQRSTVVSGLTNMPSTYFICMLPYPFSVQEEHLIVYYQLITIPSIS
jgi:hypothetical protein